MRCILKNYGGKDTLLRVRAQILPNIEADNGKVGPVNNFLHSMFNQIDVFLNHKLVSQPNNVYPCRAYLETLLNYNSEAKESHLSAGLWVTDSYGAFDSLPNDENEPNKGLKKRLQYTVGGNIWISYEIYIVMLLIKIDF